MAKALTLNDFMDLAKKVKNLKSDRKLSEFLGFAGPAVNHFRQNRALPSDETMFKIADMIDLNKEYALILLSYWRAISRAEDNAANVYKGMLSTYEENENFTPFEEIANSLQCGDGLDLEDVLTVPYLESSKDTKFILC